MEDENDDDQHITAKVGWSEPSQEDFRFNFHISVLDAEWREVVDYGALTFLDRSINSDTDEFRHVPFPNIDKSEYAKISRIMIEREFIPENVRVLDRYRAVLEVWVNFILNHLKDIDDESRQQVKQLFFRSKDKIEKFEQIMLLLQNDKEKGTSENMSEISKDGGGKKKKHKNMFASIFRGKKAADKSLLALNSKNLDKVAHKSKAERLARSNVAGTETVQSREKRFSFAFLPSGARGKGVRSVTSERREDREDQALAALAEANKSTLLKIEVQRGQEMRSAGGGSVQMYNVYLRVTGKQYKKPVTHHTQQRYNSFKLLHRKLVEVNEQQFQQMAEHEVQAAPYANYINLITAPFPQSPFKCYLGISLSDSELSERTRMLDAWFHDVCYYYREMPAAARQAVRSFLNFDMSSAKDIFLQDQLAWGMIESQRADTPVLIVQRSALDSMRESYLEEMDNISQRDGAVASESRGSSSRLSFSGGPQRGSVSQRSQHGAPASASQAGDRGAALFRPPPPTLQQQRSMRATGQADPAAKTGSGARPPSRQSFSSARHAAR